MGAAERAAGRDLGLADAGGRLAASQAGDEVGAERLERQQALAGEGRVRDDGEAVDDPGVETQPASAGEVAATDPGRATFG